MTTNPDGCAITLLGMANSRLKDYFVLSVLLEQETLDADLLVQAIKATFERRGMAWFCSKNFAAKRLMLLKAPLRR
ncbi:hypothetical protein FACS1894158_05390 [Betaproteobacteria bacterium]|nr:hypothetical protein FACS1894158_05390 [Betaproteobacteria bacterium]